ncbi:MAG TPA: 16S rRNA (uracil(1498)-N(3))-methyltransferase [Dissulfurispiraceae bacterium]|nr:16S rRNA (uracil(1498)-N(3))-methyltransferase [Dissulfurispiraceae bacterium]
MRIYLLPELIARKTEILIPAEKSHHLLTVMRCGAGDMLTVIDGMGKAYAARISAISKKKVMIDILHEENTDSESPVNMVLCQGVLKGEKMDLVIQKATELGINEIVPMITGRSQVRETRKTARWRKIAEEAAEQCGRAVIPVVRSPRTFGEILAHLNDEQISGGIIFWEEGGLPLDDALMKTGFAGRDARPDKGKLALMIGPEGGFSASEVEDAEFHGLIRASLGRRILRSETAAIAAVALLQFVIERQGIGLKSLI